MYSGSARFKIVIQILHSDCATTVQTSTIGLIEYIEKSVKKEKINKALLHSCIGVNCTPKKIRGEFSIITNVVFRLTENNQHIMPIILRYLPGPSP